MRVDLEDLADCSRFLARDKKSIGEKLSEDCAMASVSGPVVRGC